MIPPFCSNVQLSRWFRLGCEVSTRDKGYAFFLSRVNALRVKVGGIAGLTACCHVQKHSALKGYTGLLRHWMSLRRNPHQSAKWDD